MQAEPCASLASSGHFNTTEPLAKLRVTKSFKHERFLKENTDSENNLDFSVHFESLCSVGIRSTKRDNHS